MKDKLLKLMDNAYDPYYKFPVSCIVVSNDGNEYGGVNVGNVNGTSVCAERNAIHSAIAAGCIKGDFKEIYVMAKKLVTPCFACRQVFVEFLNDNIPVIMMDQFGEEKRYTVAELCPYAFTKENVL